MSDDAPEPDEATDSDVELALASVEELGDPDGYFDGVEQSPSPGGSSGSSDSSDATSGSSYFDGEESASGGGNSTGNDGGPNASGGDAGGFGNRGGMLAQNINAGFSRMAVIGLDDGPEKTDLQKEFLETFQTFQLGYYGEEVVHEYLDPEMEDIHPVAGLIGAMLLCTAVVVYKRPDGDEIMADVRGKVFGDDEDEIEFDLSDYEPPEPSEPRPDPAKGDPDANPLATDGPAEDDAQPDAQPDDHPAPEPTPTPSNE